MSFRFWAFLIGIVTGLAVLGIVLIRLGSH